jgi:hypothetical protein
MNRALRVRSLAIVSVLVLALAMSSGGSALATRLAATTSTSTSGSVWFFGDSITAAHVGGWVAWWQQLNPTARVKNYAQSGAVLDAANGWNTTLHDQIEGALNDPNNGGLPSEVIIAIGTNDMISHDLNTGINSRWQAVYAQVLLGQHGIGTVKWASILPYAYGSHHPDAWVPVLEQRREQFNQWLTDMYPNMIQINMAGVLHESADFPHIVPFQEWLPDGLHPAGQATLLMAQQVAAAG